MSGEAMPDHAKQTKTSQDVAGLLGISPETLRARAPLGEIDVGRFPELASDAERQIRLLNRKYADRRKAKVILEAECVLPTKALDHLTTR